MHSLELCDLAAVFAGISSDMIALGCVPDRVAGQKYWLESRFRHDFWNSKLAAHRQNLQYLNVTHRKRSWLQVMPVIEEVLLSEPLTRCIAYHGRLLADRQIDSDLAALSQSVLTSHIEARHRCLHLIVFGEGLAVEHSTRLNQLRRTLEGFNDSILSFLLPIDPPDSYSFDSVSIHHAQTNREKPVSHLMNAKLLQLSSLRIAFRLAIARRLGTVAASQNSNRKIHEATVRFFPPSLFDGLGLPLTTQTAALRAESPESSAAMEVLTKPAVAPIGFLFEPNCTRPRPASTGDRRW
jgi:hypothetical protein